MIWVILDKLLVVFWEIVIILFVKGYKSLVVNGSKWEDFCFISFVFIEILVCFEIKIWVDIFVIFLDSIVILLGKWVVESKIFGFFCCR